MEKPQLRQPIVTIAGHVDHGKTSLLDAFRGSSFQEDEAGGITQKISFTKYPFEQICKACPLIEKNKIQLDIPGFLFIDTPGHAAFTSLRKRGGALADLAVVVVSVKEGIKPQTAEVLQILKANKTPFVIALNKIDSISGWKKGERIRESLDNQVMHSRLEFDEAFLTFQGSLKDQGFDSDLFFNVEDFTKKVAIVPCSARSGEGIAELLLVLCGLCQKFLKERLKISPQAKGVILEVKKEKTMEYVEAILYDGFLDESDEIVIASFGEPIVAKVRSIQEILPLSRKYKSSKSVVAATGVRVQLSNRENILPGMPFQEVKDDLESVKEQFRKEFANLIVTDKQGIIAKADSLGSLEALMFLLKQANIRVIKAGIGQINKTDVISAKASLETNALDAVVVGFNVGIDEEIDKKDIKIITNDVVYKLIEDLQEWRKKRQEEIEKERILGLASICKLEILHKYVFRNSNPAIFGIKVLAGKLKAGIPLINEKGEEVARVKSLQHDKASVEEATEGQEIALALPGVTFDRQLKDCRFLYSYLSSKQIKQLWKNEDILIGSEKSILNEIEAILPEKK